MNEVDTPTPNTPVSIRRATLADAPQIGALLRAAKNENLPAEKRAEKGFVQGNMSDDNLHTWLESPQRGGMVAVQANEIVGVCMFSPAGPAPADHPSGGLYTTIQQSDLDAERTMVFGPLAVTPSAAGQRLSGRLIHAVQEESRRLGTSAIVSFVDDANRKSTRLHHNLGFDVLGTFEHKGRPFTAFELQ